jgi:hypothetical protein
MALAKISGLQADGGPPLGGRAPASSSPSGNGGTPAGGSPSPGAGVLRAAEQRFAALPAAARHAWLVTHLTALRAGQITLSEIP